MSRLYKLRPFFSSAFGGLLLALAFPPLNLMALAFVALVPLLVVIRGLSFKRAFMHGYVFGLVFALPNMFWLAQFVSRWTDSPVLGAIPWLLVCLAFSVYFGLFAGAAAKAWSLRWPWAIPVAWAGVEVVRSVIPYLFFPWSQLAATQWRLPVMLQSAWWAGPYFTGAWIVLFNVLFVMLYLSVGAKEKDRPFEPRTVWIYALVALFVMGGSFVSYMQPIEGTLRTFAAAQPGVDLAFPPYEEQQRALAENVPRALAVGAAVERDLVVLPEAVSRWHLSEPEPDAPFPIDFPEATVMGGQRQVPGGAHQSAFAWDGENWTYADKIRLVIFGEYVPFRDRLHFLDAFNLPGGDILPGLKLTALDVGEMRVGPMLCFEALFEEVARGHAHAGAEVLVVMSLDDWYQDTGAIQALQAGAVLRAVENRMPVVRSASLGPSMIIDGHGNIVREAPLGVATVAQAQVVTTPARPIIARDIFPWFAGISFFVLVFWPLKRELRRRSGGKTKKAA